jgi:hypothetical protein
MLFEPKRLITQVLPSYFSDTESLIMDSLVKIKTFYNDLKLKKIRLREYSNLYDMAQDESRKLPPNTFLIKPKPRPNDGGGIEDQVQTTCKSARLWRAYYRCISGCNRACENPTDGEYGVCEPCISACCRATWEPYDPGFPGEIVCCQTNDGRCDVNWTFRRMVDQPGECDGCNADYWFAEDLYDYSFPCCQECINSKCMARFGNAECKVFGIFQYNVLIQYQYECWQYENQKFQSRIECYDCFRQNMDECRSGCKKPTWAGPEPSPKRIDEILNSPPCNRDGFNVEGREIVPIIQPV